MTDLKHDDQTGNAANNTPVSLCGEPTEEVDSFACPGSLLERHETEISLLVGKVMAGFITLQNFWAPKEIETRTKLSLIQM